MQIRFQPRRGTAEMDISGIVGGHPLARWSAGDVREIGDDEQVMFTGHDGVTQPARAIDVVLSAGPDFVDARTGKNPLHSCHDCGVEALDDAHLDRFKGEMVPYRVDSDPNKPRLCVACYLARHPHYIVSHRANGVPEELLQQAQERAAKAREPEPKPVAKAAPKAAPPTKDEPAPSEEN